MQGRMPRVQMIERPHQLLQARMLCSQEQMPVQAPLVAPFVPLPKLSPHEQQLLPRMRPHPGIEHPQIRKLLPPIPRHLVDHRSLPVHHLIMA